MGITGEILEVMGAVTLYCDLKESTHPSCIDLDLSQHVYAVIHFCCEKHLSDLSQPDA